MCFFPWCSGIYKNMYNCTYIVHIHIYIHIYIYTYMYIFYILYTKSMPQNIYINKWHEISWQRRIPRDSIWNVTFSSSQDEPATNWALLGLYQRSYLESDDISVKNYPMKPAFWLVDAGWCQWPEATRNASPPREMFFFFRRHCWWWTRAAAKSFRTAMESPAAGNPQDFWSVDPFPYEKRWNMGGWQYPLVMTNSSPWKIIIFNR